MTFINENENENLLYVSSSDDEDAHTECEPFKFTKYDDFTENFIRDNEYVLSITFDIGYYGHIIKKFDFGYDGRTVNDAIGVVEEYLNEPLTNAYMTFLYEQNDLEDPDWAIFRIRGDCLGEKTIIKNIEFKYRDVDICDFDSEPDNVIKKYYDIVLCLEA